MLESIKGRAASAGKRRCARFALPTVLEAVVNAQIACGDFAS